jgi:hypothetical protein
MHKLRPVSLNEQPQYYSCTSPSLALAELHSVSRWPVLVYFINYTQDVQVYAPCSRHKQYIVETMQHMVQLSPW